MLDFNFVLLYTAQHSLTQAYVFLAAPGCVPESPAKETLTTE